jgi:hypothetical protein
MECICLCLIEVQADGIGSDDAFVNTGEKVWRRLGTGNFGPLPSMLRQDKLLIELGAYPEVQARDEQGQEPAMGFKRKEAGFEVFVLI